MMLCSDRELTIMAYVDGELDLTAILDIESHLAGCEACARTLVAFRQLKNLSSDRKLIYQMPADLGSRIAATLKVEVSDTEIHQFRRSFEWRPMLAAAAAIMIVGIVFGRLTANVFQPTPAQIDDNLDKQVVASHVRSLMANHLYDVVSTDQHTVKPWFAGRIDFSPPVTDFVAQGFPLVGGRLDYIDGRPVAAVVYRHKKHFINLFVWPDPSSPVAPMAEADQDGYHVVHWERGGMSLWAVSDMDAKGLTGFANLHNGAL